MITVRFFAGARAAAGTAEQKLAATTIDDLVTLLTAEHGEPLARVLAVASFLVDGTVCHDRAAAIPDGAAIDVLPPFAGG
jgi:molybdopterin synthase sulfur carrier subunit